MYNNVYIVYHFGFLVLQVRKKSYSLPPKVNYHFQL